MGNTFGKDILIQSPDPRRAAAFYVDRLGFEVTGDEPGMVSLKGNKISLFIEDGPALGPVLEETVPDVAEASKRLVENGCAIVKDEPEVPRVYVRDPFGLTYNLTS